MGLLLDRCIMVLVAGAAIAREVLRLLCGYQVLPRFM